MTNGSLETIDGRPALRFERRLDHSVERVWRAITEPSELARWFVVPVEWTPEAGERFESMGEMGEITQLEPPRLFEYTWRGELLRFELRPERDGCVLVFTHVFNDRSLGAQQAAGWHIYLDRLDTHLRGEFVTEDEVDRAFPELHERYAERFRLDPEAGRRAVAAMQEQQRVAKGN